MNSPVRLGVSPTATSTPKGFSISGFEALFPPSLNPGIAWSVSLPCCSSWFICTRMWGRGVRQPLFLPCVLSAQLPVPAPPTGLGECVFFNSLVVGLPHSSIFCQFWLFSVFKLLSIFWLYEEAQCICLCLHLGWK